MRDHVIEASEPNWENQGGRSAVLAFDSQTINVAERRRGRISANGAIVWVMKGTRTTPGEVIMQSRSRAREGGLSMAIPTVCVRW
jgi:hypothetical protein